MPTLVLASTSRYRRALLERAGIPFEAAAPDCDEDAYKGKGTGPRELAETLAALKARSVPRRPPASLVLGGDQVLALGDAVLSKPGTADRAREQLRQLSGQRFTLHTAIALLDGDGVRVHTDTTHLCMRELGDDAIARYVEADEPLDCAGSFRIEARGITLFSEIETRDPSAIEGVPLIALTRMLGEAGFEIP